MIPAMNVPWPFVSRYWVDGSCDSSERSGPFTILLAPLRAGTGATPVSMSATSTPLPVTPEFHHAWTPSPAVMFCIEYGSDAAL